FQNHTNRPLTDFGGKTSIFSHSVYLFLREFSLQDSRGGSMDFNIMTRLDVCKAKVRIAERTFTTFGSRGGVVFVINGAWQLGDKLLTTDQGACWFDGRHTLRLLQPQGKLLFSEINWLAGHSPDQVQ
ncbi:HutD family protein, partial [Escherichia coli]|nr:HutD family protein [Escherichia coli]